MQNAPLHHISRNKPEDGPILTPLHSDQHYQDALDLARRARDYVELEVGRTPDDAYVTEFFNAAPPEHGPASLTHYGIRKRGRLDGMICIAEGYEEAQDWWIGLLLLDPAVRSRRIGRKAVQHLKNSARKRSIKMLKLSVLYANPRGLRFWLREGFIHHREAPATPTSDGHDRVVLKYLL
ncbi:MAG: GNAT family N-acetyltransferase [Pseudomonadota bacterium]